MKLFSFYLLCEPGSYVVRYVGITTKNPLSRLSQHLRLKSGTRRKRRWLEKVGCPRLVVLSHREVTKTKALKLEKTWVKLFRGMGANLLNARPRYRKFRRRRSK